MGHGNYVHCKFYIYVSTDATVDAASCSTFASFLLTLEKSEPKMHIKHCLNSAKAIAIQETQIMHCVDAAVSDAENLCKWCLASLVNIVWEYFFKNILNDSARRLQYATHVLFSQSTVEKHSLFGSSKSVANRECWSRVVVIGYWTDNLQVDNYSEIHFPRKWFVSELWFPSRIVGVRLHVVMTSSQMQCVNSKNNRNLCWGILLSV